MEIKKMNFTQEITWIESDEKCLNMEIEFIPTHGNDFEVEEVEIISIFISLSGDDLYSVSLNLCEISYSDMEEIKEKLLKAIDHTDIIHKCHEDMVLTKAVL